MKKSYWILSSIILLYVTFDVIAAITGLVPIIGLNVVSFSTILASVGFIIGFVGIILKKQWAPIIVSVFLLWITPGYLSVYTSPPEIRLEMLVIILIIIFLNFIIYRQLKLYKNKSMRKLFKVPLMILGVLYVLFVIFITIPGILNLFAKDIPTVNETGLQIENPNIPDSANAYYDLDQITNSIYISTSTENMKTLRSIVTATSGNVWDDSLVNDIISKNQKTIEMFSNASNKSFLYNPQDSDLSKISSETILPKYNDWRNAGLIASLNALHLLKEGKNTEAMNEAIKTIKIGYLGSESNQPLIGYLVGIAIKSYGYEAALKIINQEHFNQVQKQNYLTQLNLLKDDGKGLKNSFILEYYNQKNSLKEFIGELVSQVNIPIFTNMVLNGSSYYYEQNQTTEYFADNAREEINNIDVSCNTKPDVKEKMLIKPISYFKIYFTENAVGKILHDTISASLASVLNKRCENNSRLDDVIKSLSESN